MPIAEELSQTIAKFEQLSGEIEQFESALSESGEKVKTWQQDLPELVTILTSQADELSRNLQQSQEELNNSASDAEEQLSKSIEQFETSRSELNQEVQVIEIYFERVRGEYQETDGELATLCEEAEKAFQQTQHQMDENRERLSAAMIETGTLLENEVKLAWEQAKDEIIKRGEALKNQIVNTLVPQLKEHTQQLAIHLRETAQELEDRFRASSQQTHESMDDIVQSFQRQHLDQINSLVERVRNLSGRFDRVKSTIILTGDEVGRLMDNLKSVSTDTQGPLRDVADVLKEIRRELEE